MKIFTWKKTIAAYKTYLAAALIVLLAAASVHGQELQRATLQVENLACLSCLSVIEGQLRRIPGMVGITADLENRRVSADHTPAITGSQIASVITSLGYPAQLLGEQEVDQSEAQYFVNAPPARCGTGGCSTGCNATASAWKELYRRLLGRRE